MMKNTTKFFVISTFVLLLFLGVATPALAAKPSRPQTQYLLDVGWMVGSDFWYAHVSQDGHKAATLELAVYSQALGKETFSVEKTLTSRESYHWGIRHTELSAFFFYNGSPVRLHIDFYASEKPSQGGGSKGDMTTAAGIALIDCLGSRNIRSASATVMGWSEPT
jgi:hypothetical protein